MIRLDLRILQECELFGIDANTGNCFLMAIYHSLEMRAGTRLASEMSEDELKEFEALIESGDEASALRWLEENYPYYREIVRNEFISITRALTDRSSFFRYMLSG